MIVAKPMYRRGKVIGKKVVQKVLWLGILALFMVAVSPEAAMATPTFAQEYHTGCMTCHIKVPKLNAFGKAFKDQGYSPPEDAASVAYLADRREGHQLEHMRGEVLFRIYCMACHGEGAKGGVKNTNYVKETVPALDTLAERMFLEDREDAAKVADLLRQGVDITTMTPKLDVPHRGRVLAQYKAIRSVIEKGSLAGKEDPNGPEPLLHMPSWTEGLSQNEINEIISYLLTLYPWEQNTGQE